jgi:hypothetical protein
MKRPIRSKYPDTPAGQKAYDRALAKYTAYLEGLRDSAQTEALAYSPIQLPGVSTESGINPTQAKAWFKFTGPNAAKGTPARDYYDNFVAGLRALGIPKDKWQDAWDDAVDYTQAVSNDSGGKPASYLRYMNAGDFADKTATKKYGTTKSKQTTITEYSASSAAADANKAMEAELGRTATSAETAAYLKAVNEKAKKEASIYEATTTTSPGKGGVDQSVTTATQKTGFDPTIFAQNFARSMPDYAESFAAKNVLKIIEGLIGSDRTAIGKVVQ